MNYLLGVASILIVAAWIGHCVSYAREREFHLIEQRLFEAGDGYRAATLNLRRGL